MTIETTEIYQSPDGERWSLVRADGRVFVRHQPPEGSDGQSTDTDIETFLAQPRGPEQEALLKMVIAPPTVT